MAAADPGDIVIVAVTLEFSHDGAEYTATHTATYEKQVLADFDGTLEDTELIVEYDDGNRTYRRGNPGEILSQIIPKQLSELFFFDPHTVRVTVGEEVVITFHNVGSVAHDFVIGGPGVRTPTIQAGRTATVRWYDGEPVGDSYLRGQFQGLKDVVGDMIDRGVFSEAIARRYLMEKLAEWVGERQELLVPTGESATT